MEPDFRLYYQNGWRCTATLVEVVEASVGRIGFPTTFMDPLPSDLTLHQIYITLHSYGPRVGSTGREQSKTGAPTEPEGCGHIHLMAIAGEVINISTQGHSDVLRLNESYMPLNLLARMGISMGLT